MKRALPYPGIISERGKVNLESIRENFFKLIFFEFSKDILNKSVYLTTIPRNHLIYSISPIFIEEAFNGINVFLNVGINIDLDSVLNIRINNVLNNIVLLSYSEVGKNFGSIITVDTQIFITVKYEGSPPTRGSGYGIITLLNLGRVEGF